MGLTLTIPSLLVFRDLGVIPGGFTAVTGHRWILSSLLLACSGGRPLTSVLVPLVFAGYSVWQGGWRK